MLSFLKQFHQFSVSIGFDFRAMFRSCRGILPFVRDLLTYKRMAGPDDLPLTWWSIMPVLADRYDTAGSARGHYFFMDLWAARKVFALRPDRHVDIGSRIDGFVCHLLAFMPQVEVIDIRAMEAPVSGLKFVQDDATMLRQFADNSLYSVSSLHAAEHFGLGRYGDPIDPNGHRRFMAALDRVLAPGGQLLFAVPVGKARLAFNAQRIIAPEAVIKAMPNLRLKSFSAVLDDGCFVENVEIELVRNSYYSLGLFEFTKETSTV